MQATISRPVGNISVPIRYNEQKVARGKAERIRAENFLKDHDRLSVREITRRFRDLASLMDHPHAHVRHISVNFGKEENLSNERISQLTERYMSGMGFEDQPYIVYRHYDSGHHHAHIVTTTARSDRIYISMGPKDYHYSKELCQALEKEFSLERYVAAKPSQQAEFAVERAPRVIYGETGLTHAVSDVLNTVVDHYNYTSLEELNAVLKQYNVEANSGTPGSRLRNTGGLLYHALDDNGDRIGVPLKASKFLLKPTLKNLGQRFERNETQREASRERLSTAIEWALAGRTPDWAAFTASLEKEGISIVLVRDEDRIFFVDHTGRSSFEGKNLGEGYVLEALRQRCAPAETLPDELIQQQQLRLHL